MPFPKTGGKVRWVTPEDQKATRKKSDKEKGVHRVCNGGPLHNTKIKQLIKIGHGGKRFADLVPSGIFTVPPYNGCYIWNEETERYEWND